MSGFIAGLFLTEHKVTKETLGCILGKNGKAFVF